jgi:hypothetical protein
LRPFLYIYNKGIMTHQCTSCGKTLNYVNKGSWKNAKHNLKKTGILRCAPCAGKEGQLTRKTKPSGRPKGSKNKDNSNIKNNLILFNKSKITVEQRQKAIATRHGFSCYQEYVDSLPEWKRYRNEVDRLTKQQPLHELQNYNKRGPNGKEGAYTLDHIMSVAKGFKTGIEPSIIAHINNLRMIPWKDNILKGWRG